MVIEKQIQTGLSQTMAVRPTEDVRRIRELVSMIICGKGLDTLPQTMAVRPTEDVLKIQAPIHALALPRC